MNNTQDWVPFGTIELIAYYAARHLIASQRRSQEPRSSWSFDSLLDSLSGQQRRTSLDVCRQKYTFLHLALRFSRASQRSHAHRTNLEQIL